MKYQRVILIIGILILGSYFVWNNYFSQEELEKRIEYEQGYKIINQSQYIEIEFNFDPSWIPNIPNEGLPGTPKESEATNKINRIIYEGHSSVIYLEWVLNRSAYRPYLVLQFLIKPTYNYEGGEYLGSYIIEKNPRGFRTLIIKCYTKNASEYLFGWDDIPGNDTGKLIDFLKQSYSVDWVKAENIKKSDDCNTISASAGNNSLSLSLNNDKTKVNLKIDDRITDEFTARIENGKLNIYLSDDQSCRYAGDLSGKHIDIYLNRQLLSNVDHPITIKFGPLNLIKYTKS